MGPEAGQAAGQAVGQVPKGRRLVVAVTQTYHLLVRNLWSLLVDQEAWELYTLEGNRVSHRISSIETDKS